MTNLFVSLPTPIGNGAGTAVNVSTLGSTKTVTVGSGGGVFQPFVTVEISNDAGGVKWAALQTFRATGEATFDVACRWMRAVVSQYRDGGAPAVEVGADDNAPLFATLVAPSGNGIGAGVNVSTLGAFKTVQVGGPFRGALNVEVSEDGGVTYSTAFSFGQPGFQSIVVAADFMRVSRNGVPLVGAGTPIVNVAATTSGGGGGGGGGNVQAFVYTATGSENPNGFVVGLPSTRANTNYVAQASGGGLTDLLLFDCPIADYTTTQITVVSTANLTAGDKVIIVVQDLT